MRIFDLSPVSRLIRVLVILVFIKPNNSVFEEIRALLNSYEQYIVSQRENTSGFQFKMTDPTLLDDGKIIYTNTQIVWTTSDGYNI